jgi:uncharacterized protein (DUF302 family)
MYFMDGFIARESAYDVPATLQRLKAALNAKAITIFSVIDHAEGAAQAGLSLRPTVLVIFGNPKSGTPLMQASQTAAIDLPLKILIWEDEAGKTRMAYNDPAWIAARHGAGASVASALSAMLARLAGEVSGEN